MSTTFTTPWLFLDRETTPKWSKSGVLSAHGNTRSKWFYEYHTDIGGDIESKRLNNMSDITLVWIAQHLKAHIAWDWTAIEQRCPKRIRSMRPFPRTFVHTNRLAKKCIDFLTQCYAQEFKLVQNAMYAARGYSHREIASAESSAEAPPVARQEVDGGQLVQLQIYTLTQRTKATN